MSLKNVNWIMPFPRLKTDQSPSTKLQTNSKFFTMIIRTWLCLPLSLTFYHTPLCSQKISCSQILTLSHILKDDRSLGLSPAFPSSKKALFRQLFIAITYHSDLCSDTITSPESMLLDTLSSSFGLTFYMP